jgi:hypothetical protein
MLVVLLFVGSASAGFCPPIPSPPYVPKSPEEDIVKVEAYITQPNPAVAIPPSALAVPAGPTLHLTVTFAAATPPTGQTIFILVTELQGNPATETLIGCYDSSAGASTTHQLSLSVDGVGASIAVYAMLGVLGTDRAPNSGSYPITALSALAPNLFYDPEPNPVGGVVLPTSKLQIVAPFAALAGLIIAVSAVVAVKRRKD